VSNYSDDERCHGVDDGWKSVGVFINRKAISARVTRKWEVHLYLFDAKAYVIDWCLVQYLYG